MDNHLLSIAFLSQSGRCLFVTAFGQAGQIIVNGAPNYPVGNLVGTAKGSSLIEAFDSWRKRAEKLSTTDTKEYFGPLGDMVTASTLTNYDTPQRPGLIHGTAAGSTPACLGALDNWIKLVSGYRDTGLRELAGPLLADAQQSKTAKP